jgi:hypothetical protein
MAEPIHFHLELLTNFFNKIGPLRRSRDHMIGPRSVVSGQGAAAYIEFAACALTLPFSTIGP